MTKGTAMADYPTAITLTMADGSTVVYHLDNGGPVPPDPTPPDSGYAMDFEADFSAFEPGHVVVGQAEWDKIWKAGLDKGASVYCLEDNTDATRHDFIIQRAEELSANCVELFMPRGSYGMGHRSLQVKIGKPKAPINVSFKWLVVAPDDGSNIWTMGGGKWGGAWQFGPIQSGPTGGIRFMMTWASGGSTLGKQDLTCSIQNQPDGRQWLQPPYYGYRPIEYDRWYSIRYRMTGGSEAEPMTVRCEYWKDDDPVMDYTAHTDNPRCKAGAEDVFFDLTSFFGGGAANAAPRDARFRFADIRIWVE
jgi:hypothetical protein